jgi:hypothetical protein
MHSKTSYTSVDLLFERLNTSSLYHVYALSERLYGLETVHKKTLQRRFREAALQSSSDEISRLKSWNLTSLGACYVVVRADKLLCFVRAGGQFVLSWKHLLHQYQQLFE